MGKPSFGCSVCRHAVRSRDVNGRTGSSKETHAHTEGVRLTKTLALTKCVRRRNICVFLTLSVASSSCLCELFVPRLTTAPHKNSSFHFDVSVNNKPEDFCHTRRNTTSPHPRHFGKQCHSHTEVSKMSTWTVAPTGFGRIVHLTQNESRHLYDQDILTA